MRRTRRAGGGPRVLYLITNDLSSLFLRGQLAHLQEHGFHVELGTRLESADAATKFDDGVVLHDMPYLREPDLFADLKALVATVRLVRRVRPDVVNASTPKAGLLGSIAAWSCRVPKRVYVVRGLRYETATGRRRAFFRAAEKLAIRLATDVIFNSRSLRKVAEDDGLIAPGRGIVLGNGGNGLDTNRFAHLPSRREARATFGFADGDHVIGFVGRLTKDKGVADLLEAFDLVLAERPEARLLLVGSFEPGDPVGAQARARIERDARIVHVEWMTNPGPAYRAMDVLCFPSYREGLPNVPIEAQYCGVPVVGYAATGTVDAVIDASALVAVGDASALAQRLAQTPDAVDPARIERAFSKATVLAALRGTLAGSADGRLRVLQVITDRDRRGAQVFATDLEAGLRTLGHEVRTVALAPGSGAVHLPVDALGRRRRGPGTLLRLRRAMRDADVTVAHGSATALACAVAGGGRRRPFVYRQISDTRFWAASRARRLRVAEYLRRAAAVVALSDDAKRALVEHLGLAPEKITVIPNAVPGEAFTPPSDERRREARQRFGLRPDGFVAVCVTALAPEKGVDVAIDALASCPDVELLVVGDGPERAALEERGRASAPGRVHFTGVLGEPVEAYAAADVMMLTSRGGDSMPAVLIEAGLCGLPAIATDVGSIGAIVLHRRTGLLLERADPAAVAAALRELRANDQLRAQLAAGAVQHCADEFTIEATVEMWSRLLLASSTLGRVAPGV